MSINDNVFQVLVTRGNRPVLPIGQKVENLQPGQIGVFDLNTNLSIDGTRNDKEFYLAVGTDESGNGTTDGINTSAGQFIQKKNVQNYNFRPHSPGRPMILELTDFNSDCSTDYSLKLEFKNSEIAKRQGFNQFTKTYSVRTPNCDGCEEGCNSGDCNMLAKLLIEAINADTDGFVKAEAINAAKAVVTDVDAFIAANATVNSDTNKTNDVCLGIRITTIPQTIKSFTSVNLKYNYPRQTLIIASLTGGFDSTGGTLTTTQEAIFEEGNGYDVKQDEYYAGGWNGRPGPYRTSVSTGLAKEGFKYFADTTVKYDQFTLEYDNVSESGSGTYNNRMSTYIAIPAVDTATRDGLSTVLDNILSSLGFDALSDDTAAANVNPSVIETTSGKDNVALDGIA